MSARRFRIAFSFAGEKRDFVAQVAAILARRFGEDAILYDKYHEAEFAVYDLGIRLPKLYGEQSDLIVPVLCPNYDQKRWTGWEWVHIYGLLTKADGDRVMPCRFQYSNADGLSPASGFIDLDDRTPEETSKLILERLARNEGLPKNHYLSPTPAIAGRLSTTIPNNLPRLQSFFGRDGELQAVREALDPESRTWGALIDGPGGMGKTSLAVRAAYDCLPGQFKRIIFVSVKDRELDDDGERPLNLLLPGFLEMLNEIARELGIVDFAKAADDQRIRVLLDALRSADALLILDNLESLPKSDRDQLLTFVKRLPQGCKAILTSRRRIGSGSDLVQLEMLDQEAALATLADLARHNKLLLKTNEAERLTLWKHTGGNPLLLRWVAGQLGRGSCRTFTDALDFLRTCPEGNDPLEFIFGDLADEFTPEEESTLVALTYFTLAAKVDHIAAISAVREESIGSALDALANRSLVVPDQEETHYALVPMVAEFLRKHRPNVVRETGDRLERRAFALVVENGYEAYDRFPILDAAWPTVEPALTLFLAGPNASLQTVCGALHEFLDSTGRLDQKLMLNQSAEAKAVAAGDLLSAGWRAFALGTVHGRRAQADAELECGERAATHWRNAKATGRERVIALQLIGEAHALKRNYSAAIAAYSEALQLDRLTSPESSDVAIDLVDLGFALRASGDLSGAEANFREALRISIAVGFSKGALSAKAQLGRVMLLRKNWQEGERLVREALSTADELGIRHMIADACTDLAYALLRQGKGHEGSLYARRAIDIYTKFGSPDLAEAESILRECEDS